MGLSKGRVHSNSLCVFACLGLFSTLNSNDKAVLNPITVTTYHDGNSFTYYSAYRKYHIMRIKLRHLMPFRCTLNTIMSIWSPATGMKALVFQLSDSSIKSVRDAIWVQKFIVPGE